MRFDPDLVIARGAPAVPRTVASMEKDTIYSFPLAKVGDFRFDEQVVKVFPDMIERSVPGYVSILSMIGELAERYAKPATYLYDLGCSLGACTSVMKTRVPKDCRIIAVDSSPPMLEGMRARLDGEGCSVEPVCGDIRTVEFQNCSLAVLNFTLQFVPQAEREFLLQALCSGTNPGGALVLSEKVCFPEAVTQDLLTELHHSFKRANGYSETEIAQKRQALEKTLIPETLETHLERLKRVGYNEAICWFQCFNFVSILAVK